MNDTAPAPDAALVDAAFELIAELGWPKLSLAQIAKRAGVPLADIRSRFSCRTELLLAFGRLADQSALTGALTEGPVRDRVFDIVMRRIDYLQAHRAGMLALLHELPRDPLLAAQLGATSLRSMAWMLAGIEVDTTGLSGHLRVVGMQALWLATVRAWAKDATEDLAATMAALDAALNRAEQAEATMADLLGSKHSLQQR